MKRIFIIILACIAVFSCIQMIQQQAGKDTDLNQDTINPELTDTAEAETIETMTDSEIDKNKTKKVESKEDKTLDLELQLTE